MSESIFSLANTAAPHIGGAQLPIEASTVSYRMKN
jgi:hypothetical protein